ncbi:uncharacterized protein LOC102700496 [Oryza brachyantha]|uniref:Uncharacterized protein n=1 Tax=Oryza brachyantha TaxID=4533 RepID=J3LDZ8_ORYBR|nr:uncharacterized protein LOC102700496 [Oryza brachyantha]
MEQDLPALKPQWLMQGQVTTTGATNLWTVASTRPGPDNQGRGGSSKNHSSGHSRDQNSRASSSRVSGSNGPRKHDRDGMGKSRGYASFGRNREREREKDFDSRDRESRSVTTERDGFASFSTCRPERDRLNRSRPKTDTWNKGVVSPKNCNTSRSNTGGVSFEREFPQLSFEDKNGRQDISRVPSPSITSPIQRIPPVAAPDRWNSVLADVPVSSEPKKNFVVSSVSRPAPSKQPEAAPSSGTSLSMAETVMQLPLRISVGPQVSTEAQKIEEITLRQNTLRPMTSPAIKSSITSSSKTKGARNGDSSGPSKATHQSLIPSTNGSARAPVKTDLSKLSQPGSFKILTREQKCATNTAKDCPDNPMSPPPAPIASVEPLKKPCVSQKLKVAPHDIPLSPLQGAYVDKKLNPRDKHKFFESLRTKSSNGANSTVESGCPLLSSVADVKCVGNGKCSCEESNSSDGSQRHLSDNENNSSLEHTADGVSHNLLLERSNSSCEPADRGAEFRVFLSNNTEGSSSSAAADSDDGYKRSHSGSEEASSSSEATELGDDEHPAEDSLPADFVAFMISLGWEKDKVVEPLGLEEIAVTVRANEELEQKLLSMEDNANIKIVLLYIYSGRGLDNELQKPNAGTKTKA